MWNHPGWEWEMQKERHNELLRTAEQARLIRQLRQTAPKEGAHVSVVLFVLALLGKMLVRIGSWLESQGTQLAEEIEQTCN